MSNPFTTLSSRIAYQNRWLRIREDRILHKDGSPGLYGVVERTDFVVIVPVRDGCVTLVEQYRYPVGERVWEFPMGSMADPSTGVTAEAAAAAELREETGMTAAWLEQVGTIFQGPGYCTQRGHIFLAHNPRDGEPEREASELDMICHWVSVLELEAMIRDGRVCESMTLSAFSLLRLRGLL